MKLLHCLACEDIRSMVLNDWVTCRCGKSRGRYVDPLHAVIDGDDAVALGIANSSLEQAVERHLTDQEKGVNVKEGPPLEAWVIPHNSPRVGRPIPCPCGEAALVAAPRELTPCPCGRATLDISLMCGMSTARWIMRSSG